MLWKPLTLRVPSLVGHEGGGEEGCDHMRKCGGWLAVAQEAVIDTMHALLSQERPDQAAARRGKTPEEITPPALLAAYRTAELGSAVTE